MASEKIKYKAEDAVAFIPLIVGLRQAGSFDQGLLQPLCTYKPPNADVSQQCWRLRNAEMYSVVYAAMKKCNAGVQYSLNNPDLVEKSSVTAGGTKDQNRNYFFVAWDRISSIEASIKVELGRVIAADGNHAARNACSVRTCALEALKSRLKLIGEDSSFATMFNFIKQNCTENEKQMNRLFGMSGVSTDAWAGLNKFGSFWDTYVKQLDDAKTKNYADLVLNNEKAAMQNFLKIIDCYAQIHTALKDKLTEKFDNSVIQKYFTPDDAKDTKRAVKEKEVSDIVDGYLWNALRERLEVLDSIVCTFFSIICCSRSDHYSISKKFMDNAIVFCLAPFFSALKPSKTKSSEDSDSVTKNTIIDFFKRHSGEFKTLLGKLFPRKVPDDGKPTGLASKVPLISENDRCMISVRFSNQLLKVVDGKPVLVGPAPENTAKTELFTGIETMMENAFRLVSDISLKTLVSKSTNHNDGVLKIHRDIGRRLEVLDIINGILKPLTPKAGATPAQPSACVLNAKKIAYYRIFSDSVTYGIFHFKMYEPTKFYEEGYFDKSKSPLSLSEKSRMAGYTKEKMGADAKIKYSRVDPPTVADGVVTDISVAITTAIELGNNFNPARAAPQKNSQKSKKSQGGKGSNKNKKNGQNNNNGGKGSNNTNKNNNGKKTEKKTPEGPKGGGQPANSPAKKKGKGKRK
jgi:hypothetical protein